VALLSIQIILAFIMLPYCCVVTKMSISDEHFVKA